MTRREFHWLAGDIGAPGVGPPAPEEGEDWDR